MSFTAWGYQTQAVLITLHQEALGRDRRLFQYRTGCTELAYSPSGFRERKQLGKLGTMSPSLCSKVSITLRPQQWHQLPPNPSPTGCTREGHIQVQGLSSLRTEIPAMSPFLSSPPATRTPEHPLLRILFSQARSSPGPHSPVS